MTERRAMRRAASGMSVSFCFVGLEVRDERLDRDASARDELPPGSAHRRGERRSPTVLEYEQPSSAAGFERGRDLLDIFGAQHFGDLGLEPTQVSHLAFFDVGDLKRVETAVVFLLNHHEIEYANDP